MTGGKFVAPVLHLTLKVHVLLIQVLLIQVQVQVLLMQVLL